MIGRILKIGLVLVAGFLGYTYFFGNAEEKAQSREIVGDIGQAGKKIFGKIGTMLNKQKNNFDEGRHDEALATVGGELEKLKAKVKNDKLLEKALEKLKEEKDEIADKVRNASPEDKQKLKDRFRKLIDGTKNLLKDLDAKE